MYIETQLVNGKQAKGYFANFTSKCADRKSTIGLTEWLSNIYIFIGFRMFNRLGVLSSDALNRDGYVIAFEALEQMVADTAVRGMPQLVDHDFHRPLGWIIPFCVLIEPKFSRSIGSFYYGDNDEDFSSIQPRIEDHWTRINYEACKPHIEVFKTILAAEFSESGKFIEKGAVAYHSEKIVSRFFPNLFDNLDKSGLVYLNDILKEFDYAGQGIFKSKTTDLCIFCHQYFKRSLSLLNSYNTYFLDEFISLNGRKDITLRIAIDENLIGLSKTIQGSLEFDYWWGPKFTDDIANLPDGVTRYEANSDQKFFSNLMGTEFWWKTDKNEKTLEIEEIREKPSLGVGRSSYGCRYIHSIFDTDTNDFIHFDGAVRMYDEEQILERWENNINKAGKNTAYTKLFRIDGKLELADWKKLCILYYKSNPMLFEYFGAKDEYENVRNSNKTIPLSKEEELIPHKIEPEDGVRILASYFQKRDDYNTFERKVVNPDSLQFRNNDVMDILEYDIIEIEKYIKRSGGRLAYPDNIRFVKPFDFYTNYPFIIHGSGNTEELVKLTMQAYQSVIEIQNQKLNKTITFTIAWEMEKFEVRLSIFGRSSEIEKWLKHAGDIPVDYPSFRKWLKEQCEWVYSNYEYRKRDFLHLVQQDGAFFMKRSAIDYTKISFPDENDKNYFEIEAGKDEALMKLMEEKKIFPAHLGLLNKVTCTKTGENYLTSNTSKYFDKDVQMAVEEIDLLGFFWTDEQYT